MPRTLKGKWARSYAYRHKQEQRGCQKIEDRASHHRHRNANANANEVTFVKFNCKFPKKNIVNYGCINESVHNPANLKWDLDDYDWKQETLVEFLLRKLEENPNQNQKRWLDPLKQLDRRGENKRFVSHGRRFKQLDELL